MSGSPKYSSVTLSEARKREIEEEKRRIAEEARKRQEEMERLRKEEIERQKREKERLKKIEEEKRKAELLKQEIKNIMKSCYSYAESLRKHDLVNKWYKNELNKLLSEIEGTIPKSIEEAQKMKNQFDNETEKLVSISEEKELKYIEKIKIREGIRKALLKSGYSIEEKSDDGFIFTDYRTIFSVNVNQSNQLEFSTTNKDGDEERKCSNIIDVHEKIKKDMAKDGYELGEIYWGNNGQAKSDKKYKKNSATNTKREDNVNVNRR